MNNLQFYLNKFPSAPDGMVLALNHYVLVKSCETLTFDLLTWHRGLHWILPQRMEKWLQKAGESPLIHSVVCALKKKIFFWLVISKDGRVMIPVVGTDTSLNRNRNWAHLNRFSYKKNVAPSSMHSSVLSTSAYLLSAFIRLFPLREPGVNYMASELTKKEIEVSVSQLTLLCHFNCYSSFFVCLFFFCSTIVLPRPLRETRMPKGD